MQGFATVPTSTAVVTPSREDLTRLLPHVRSFMRPRGVLRLLDSVILRIPLITLAVLLWRQLLAGAGVAWWWALAATVLCALPLSVGADRAFRHALESRMRHLLPRDQEVMVEVAGRGIAIHTRGTIEHLAWSSIARHRALVDEETGAVDLVIETEDSRLFLLPSGSISDEVRAFIEAMPQRDRLTYPLDMRRLGTIALRTLLGVLVVWVLGTVISAPLAEAADASLVEVAITLAVVLVPLAVLHLGIRAVIVRRDGD